MERIHSFALIAGLAKRRVVFAGAIAAAVALVGTKVLADDASDIEQFYTTGQVVTYDNTSGDYPVITAIPSYPGVTGGHTYTGRYWLRIRPGRWISSLQRSRSPISRAVAPAPPIQAVHCPPWVIR